MTSQLLTEVKGAVALPSCPFHFEERGCQGLIWDPELGELVDAALPSLRTLQRRSDLILDSDQLQEHLGAAWQHAPVIETAAVFGGYLLRHFGHFCHESLARLWWLGSGDPQNQFSQDLCSQLRDQCPDVYFYMPFWQDPGKDLLAYMQEILAGLGLPQERIHILIDPCIFTKLLIPAQAWGFDLDPQQLDQRLGCDSKALMRSLLASFNIANLAGSPAAAAEREPARQVFVSRSGLPLHQGRPIGDAWLDVVLQEAGYLVFRPEQHSIRQQVEVFSGADQLVFIDGSAMYLLWFAKMRPGAKISIILRRRQGQWMCDKVSALMAIDKPIKWQVINEIVSEDLTSTKDWESHNLLDLAAIARHLLGPRAGHSSPRAEQALAHNLDSLVSELGSAEISRTLQVLIRRLVVSEPGPERNLMRRLRQRAGRLLRFSRRPASPG